MAKMLIVLGLVFLAAGALMYLFSRMGLNLGRIPGNIRVEMGNATCVVALGISILLSILLTVALNIIVRLMNR